MASAKILRGIHRVTMTLGLALLLIGIILLTVSSHVFILGACFLGIGSFLVLSYFMMGISSCMKKPPQSQDAEREGEAATRTRNQSQTEIDTRQFDAPRYDEVIVCGSSTVWTVTLGQGTETEPPPYSAFPHYRKGTIGEIRMPPPTLLRISSDIHEFKDSGMIYGESWPEPLTPPPSYNDTMRPFDDVFEPSP